MKKQSIWLTLAVSAVIIIACSVGAVLWSGSHGGTLVGSWWAFVPALVAIALALTTKQVYVSLFIGIFAGAMFLEGGNPVYAMADLYGEMSGKVGGNASILVFLVCLGIIVALMGKSGGSYAYGQWAMKKIKNRKGAMFASAALGCLIFVDDYFNCLTVGSIMRPVTERYKVSKAKLAYIIDSTAAPICIIAPISSWAAAVAGNIEGESGIMTFIKTIPFNLYALLTIAMVFITIALGIDFFKMKKNEKIAMETGDLTAGETDLPAEDLPESEISHNGKVSYLVVPIVLLLICCIGAMIFSGFFYNWDTGLYGRELMSANLIEAFSNCDAGSSLAVGSTFALIFTIAYYCISGAMSFKKCTDCFTIGFKAMVPAILILTFAWTLSGIMGAKGGGLEARTFVSEAVGSIGGGMISLLPAVFFIIACFISFSTGTSWGTFGILIPLAMPLVDNIQSDVMLYVMMSAILAGAVYGDHVSPISDTTIMSSSGAQCNHVDHVKTQLPYASLVAIICLIAYVILGFVASSGIGYGAMAGISLGTGAVLLTVAMVISNAVSCRSK